MSATATDLNQADTLSAVADRDRVSATADTLSVMSISDVDEDESLVNGLKSSFKLMNDCLSEFV